MTAVEQTVPRQGAAQPDAPGRVREHFKNIVFRARVVLVGVEKPFALPQRLPAGFCFARIVALVAHVMQAFGTMRIGRTRP